MVPISAFTEGLEQVEAVITYGFVTHTRFRSFLFCLRIVEVWWSECQNPRPPKDSTCFSKSTNTSMTVVGIYVLLFFLGEGGEGLALLASFCLVLILSSTHSNLINNCSRDIYALWLLKIIVMVDCIVGNN